MQVLEAGESVIQLRFFPDGRLRLTRTLKWKLGPLHCVTFSLDGMLGAAGSHDGRIVVWDAEP